MNDNKILYNSHIPDNPEGAFGKMDNAVKSRINATPENAGHGLAKLVLTLIELVRKLVEKQALRRVEGGSLTEEEIERLGETLMKLELKMEELKNIFHFTDDDLNIDLGPIGKLL